MSREYRLDGEAAADCLKRVLQHRSGQAAHDAVLEGFYGDSHADSRRLTRALRSNGDCSCLHDGATLAADAMLSVEYPKKGARLWWQLVKAGHSAPFRANYDPAALRAKGRSLPTVPPIVLDSRGKVVSGPAYALRGADGAPDALALELQSAVPLTRQTFATSHGPADPLYQIIADVAEDPTVGVGDTETVGLSDAARLYAYVIWAIINHEAGKLAGGGYDPTSINYNFSDGLKPAYAGGTLSNPPDTSGRTIGSTDYGLGQINSKYHPDILGIGSDPRWATAWQDARNNINMIAEVLWTYRQKYGDANLSQILSTYGNPTSAAQEIAWIKALGVDPANPSTWTMPDAPTPDGSTTDAAATTPIADATTATPPAGDSSLGTPAPAPTPSPGPTDGTTAQSTAPPSPTPVTDYVWIGALAVLFAAGVYLVYLAASATPRRLAGAH